MNSTLLQKVNPVPYVDAFLNPITMYKLVLYGLSALVGVSAFFNVAGILDFSVWQLGVTVLVLLASCYGANTLCAWVLRVPVNVESSWITALILYFVVSPVNSLADALVVAAIGALSMTTKYLLAWNKKHIFNPAAIVLVLAGVMGLPVASWWVANPVMAPFVFLIGLLVIRKVRRFELVATFVLTASVGILGIGLSRGAELPALLMEMYASWPIMYFAAFMLTEPLTTPPTRQLRLAYGVIVGAFFGAQFQVWRFYATPELALVIGNIFAYLVSPKYRVVLRLKKQLKVARDTYHFIFQTPQKISFQPGQFMEWTLPHVHPDSRGNRRYFTLASSPTESDIHLGVRLSHPSSSFKKALMEMKPGSEIVAGQLAGDFTLPDDCSEPMVFIAGGIGVTPFRSMVQYLIDKKQDCNVTLFYINRHQEDIAYREVFEQAEKEIGLKTVHVLTDEKAVPSDWSGEQGYITVEMIEKHVANWSACRYYLSGPNAMVTAYQRLLGEMGVSPQKIVTDYFPGF